MYLVADLPLAEDVPPVRGAVRTGRRGAGWRADAPATLVWTEAQDGGDPRTAADVRDRVSLLPAPFTSAPTELAALALRRRPLGRRRPGPGGRVVVADPPAPHLAGRPGRPADERRLLFDRSFEDRYADPGRRCWAHPGGNTSCSPRRTGRACTSPAPAPHQRATSPSWIASTSNPGRASACGAAPPYYEYAIDFVDPRAGRLLTRREGHAEPPNYYIRRLDPTALPALPALPARTARPPSR